MNVGRTPTISAHSCLVRASSAVAAAAIIASVAGVAAAQVPSINIERTCQAAENVTSSLATQRDIDLCLNPEQNALVQLTKEWDGFSDADKRQCIRPKVYLPSYVEWLTCLEMERDARKLRNGEPWRGASFRPPFEPEAPVSAAPLPVAVPVVLPRPRPDVATVATIPAASPRHRRIIRRLSPGPAVATGQFAFAPAGPAAAQLRKRTRAAPQARERLGWRF